MKRITCLAILLVCCSCIDQREAEINSPINLNSESQLEEIHAQKVKGQTIPLEEKYLLGVYDMLCLRDMLILCRAYAQPTYFEAFSLADDTHLGSFIGEGGGPGEFVGILSSFVADRGKGTIGLVPRGYGSYYSELQIDSVLKNPEYVPIKKFEFNDFGVLRAQKLVDGDFVLSALSTPKRLVILDSIGNKRDEFLSYPHENELINISQGALALVFQSEMVRNYKENKVGLFSYASPAWDIATIKSGAVVEIKSVHLRAPEIKDQSTVSESGSTSSVAFYTTNKEAFIDVVSTDNFIYGLYSGVSPNEDPGGFDFSNTILKMDWNGNLVGKFELDRETKVIEISEDDQYLFAYIEGRNKSSVRRYSMLNLK